MVILKYKKRGDYIVYEFHLRSLDGVYRGCGSPSHRSHYDCYLRKTRVCRLLTWYCFHVTCAYHSRFSCKARIKRNGRTVWSARKILSKLYAIVCKNFSNFVAYYGVIPINETNEINNILLYETYKNRRYTQNGG